MSQGLEETLFARIGRGLDRYCHGLGLVGGLMMVAAMLTLVAHVIGNAFGVPILGADEFVELLIGASIICFLAPCHLQGANIVVDCFSKPLPQVVRNVSDLLLTLIFALVVALLTWRLIVGGLSAFARDKQSMFLRLPEWPTYLIDALACSVWVLTIFYTTWSASRVLWGLSPAATPEPSEARDG
jgi:TRAP-type C4-dicarboxylate transport system permease small subunit